MRNGLVWMGGLGLVVAALLAPARAFGGTAFSALAEAPRVRLKIDTSNAEATLRLLEPGVSQAEVERFKGLPATSDLIRRAKDWKMELTPDDLVGMLRRAREGEKKNVFGYDRVVAEKDKIGALIARTSAEQPALERFLAAELAPYLPTGNEVELDVVMILGGFSSGFTFGDSSRMYVGAHTYDGDFVGFRNMLLHEAFHNVQAASLPERDLSTCLAPGELEAYKVMDAVFREGSAEYVADLWADRGPSPYSDRLKENMMVNANAWRYQAIEKLINYMVVSAADGGDNRPDRDVLSIILTDWNWNNPGYYYGYRTTKKLVEKHGKDRLAQYLREGPSAFFRDHLTLLKETDETGAFSPRFAEIVATIDRKAAACPIKTA